MFFGDILDPDEEDRRTRTIDNQLFGAIRAHSGGNGLIRTGDFSVEDAGGGLYNVVLNDPSSEPSLEAFINQIYVASDGAVRWEGLANSTTYFLFARLVETAGGVSSRTNKDFLTVASTVNSVPDDGILIASASISEPGSSTFDLNPAGLLIVPDLGAHIADNQDPHGTTLYQETLVTSGLDVLNTLTFQNLHATNLTLSGENTFSGLLEVFGNFQVSGELIVSGEVQFLDAFLQNATIVSGTMGFLGVASGMDVFGTALFRQDITMSGNTLVDGRDISADGATLDAHLIDFSNPHQVTADQIGALSISGGFVAGDILLSSGVAIDGIDPSDKLPLLLSGINVDNLHTHTFGALIPPTRQIGRAPQYCDTVESGIFPGDMTITTDQGFNVYQWNAGQDDAARRVITQQYVPSDMLRVNTIRITSRVDAILSGDSITLDLLDTDGNTVPLTGGGPLANLTYTTDTVTASGGQFTAGEFFTLSVEAMSTSGFSAYIADEVIEYTTVSGT